MRHKATITIEVDPDTEKVYFNLDFKPAAKKDNPDENKAAVFAMRVFQLLIEDFVTIRMIKNAQLREANMYLIAAAPEMYSNEEKNLEILKIVQDVYTELKYLIEHDSDVKACLPNLPEDTFDLILKKIKIRIIKTENALKKARGEE